MNKYANAKLINVNINLKYSYSKEIRRFINKKLPVENDSIELTKVMSELEKEGIDNLDDTAISFFDEDMKYNIFCGIYPKISKVNISLKSLEHQNIGESQINYELTINSRFIPKNRQDKIKMELGEEQLSPQHEEEKEGNNKNDKRSRRSKERKLGVIIEKVYLWRKLYSGFFDEKKGQVVKMTLEEAAEKVGISKKSLDDYLNQLKFGKTNGFNYNDNKNSKVGILRIFLRKKLNW